MIPPDELREWLESSGTSKAELARKMGVSTVSVFRWLSGRSVPSPEYEARLRTLMAGGGVTVPDVLSRLVTAIEALPDAVADRLDARATGTGDAAYGKRLPALPGPASLRSMLSQFVERRGHDTRAIPGATRVEVKLAGDEAEWLDKMGYELRVVGRSEVVRACLRLARAIEAGQIKVVFIEEPEDGVKK